MKQPFGVRGRVVQAGPVVLTADDFVVVVNKVVSLKTFKRTMLSLAALLLAVLKAGTPITLRCSTGPYRPCVALATTQKRKRNARKGN